MPEVTINKDLLYGYIDFIMTYFKDWEVNHGCMEPTIVNGAMKKYHGNLKLFNVVWILLQINGFITVDQSGRHFVRLAERGYEYIHSDEPVPLDVSLQHMITGRSQEERANLLWDMIGPENAMFYTSGPAYYKTIRGYIDGLAPSLTDFLDAEQKSSKNGLRPSRMNYYRSLFMRLKPELVDYFLDSLSELINNFLPKGTTVLEEEVVPEEMPVIPWEKDNKEKAQDTNMANTKKRVFIVHGHNSDLRNQVELLLTQLGYDPIVLFKEASMSRTIMEKLEAESKDCCYSVVLYTKCDEGRVKGATDFNPRARQNVVFEHGYMCAKFGRDHVCALVEDGVEVPGDLSGVIYISYDKGGSWRYDIAKEMRAIGLDADSNLIK